MGGGGQGLRVLNINVGILGHIDSGKTSLARALSTLLSTAALDKHPQSVERGITLDLGFSAFQVCTLVLLSALQEENPFTSSCPAQPDFLTMTCSNQPEASPNSASRCLASPCRSLFPLDPSICACLLPRVSAQVDVPESLGELPYDKLQFTLVDCPGHASLIRTIIGGAQIIDMMLLVVDATKGFQTQTAECLVVGEISPTKDMVVVLNKTDLLPPQSRDAQIEKLSKRVRATMKGTKFSESKIVSTAVGQGQAPQGVDALIESLMGYVKGIQRPSQGRNLPLLFAVDHCFPIKGQGTVLTGTVLQGTMAVNDTVEIPALKLQRKVKSMQMFHRPVTSASQGDRVGVCVVQLDAKMMERGLVAAPGSVHEVNAVVASVERIRFHKSPVLSKGRYHVTLGHSTVMAEATFFRAPSNDRTPLASEPAVTNSGREFPNSGFSFSSEYLYSDSLPDAASEREPSGAGLQHSDTSRQHSDEEAEYHGPYWAVLTFDSTVVCPPGSLLIGSRLDFDVHSPSCRLAFHGSVQAAIDPGPGKHCLRVYKVKRREGVIERFADAHTVIGKGLFKKETDFTQFLGLNVRGPGGAMGTLQSSFGKSGKVKVVFKNAVPTDTPDKCLVLEFKRYVFDKSKKIIQ